MDEGEHPVYNVSDKAPASVVLLSILQHFFVLAVYMTYPVIITNSIGGDANLAGFLISATLIGSGIATLLQSSRLTGSGYILPMVPNSSYLPASMLAATAGGLPLLYGMLILTGALEMAVSRFTKYFKTFFPTEVVGVVMFLLGISIIPLAVPLFFGSVNDGPLNPSKTLLGIITLSAMILFSILPQKIFRFYALLIGILIGILSSILLGILTPDVLSDLAELPAFSVPNPIGVVSYSFDLALILPFAIGMLCILLKSAGNISMLDEYTGQTNQNNLKRGILSEGFGAAVSAAIGGIGIGSSSSNVGLSIGTGITSRKIGAGLGIFLIICGFLPAIGWFFTILPDPIMGAVVIYAISFIMLSGLQSISSRMLDNRRTFVVTIPILIGSSTLICPYLYENLPQAVYLAFNSPLTTGTILVVVLGVLFKIKVPKHRTLTFDEADASMKVFKFLLDSGKLWTLDRTQTVRIAHHLEAVFKALPAGSEPKNLTLRMDGITGTLQAKVILSGSVTEEEIKSAGQYPTLIKINYAENSTVFQLDYLLR